MKSIVSFIILINVADVPYIPHVAKERDIIWHFPFTV